MIPIPQSTSLSPFLIQLLLMAIAVAFFYLLFRFLSGRSQRQPFVGAPEQSNNPAFAEQRKNKSYLLSAACGVAGLLAKVVYYIFLFGADRKLEDLKSISHDLVWMSIIIFIVIWANQKNRPN